jgi:methionine synthase II (cobalamin-independent)
MSKLPLPERGQPLDVAYIYQLANVINDLASQVSPATYKYVTIDTPSVGKQSVKASEARILGGYVDVVNSATKSAGNEVAFSYDFPADFKYAPVCTATPINVGGTDAGKNVSVILKTITTSKVEGIVRFNATGDLSVAVNLIVIGIPN